MSAGKTNLIRDLLYTPHGDYVPKGNPRSRIPLWTQHITEAEHLQFGVYEKWDITDLLDLLKSGPSMPIYTAIAARFVAKQITGYQGGVSGLIMSPDSFLGKHNAALNIYNVETVGALILGAMNAHNNSGMSKKPSSEMKEPPKIVLMCGKVQQYAKGLPMLIKDGQPYAIYEDDDHNPPNVISYQTDTKTRRGKETKFTAKCNTPRIIVGPMARGNPTKDEDDLLFNYPLETREYVVPLSTVYEWKEEWGKVCQQIIKSTVWNNQKRKSKRDQEQRTYSILAGCTRAPPAQRKAEKDSLAPVKQSKFQNTYERKVISTKKLLNDVTGHLLAASQEITKPKKQKKAEKKEQNANKKQKEMTALEKYNHAKNAVLKQAPLLRVVLNGFTEKLRELNNTEGADSEAFRKLKEEFKVIADTSNCFVTSEVPKYKPNIFEFTRDVTFGAFPENNFLEIMHVLQTVRPLHMAVIMDSIHHVNARERGVARVVTSCRRTLGVQQIQFALGLHPWDVTGMCRNYSAAPPAIWTGGFTPGLKVVLSLYKSADPVKRIITAPDASVNRTALSLANGGYSGLGLSFIQNPLKNTVTKRIVDITGICESMKGCEVLYSEITWVEYRDGKTVKITTPVFDEIGRDLLGSPLIQIPGSATGSILTPVGEMSSDEKREAFTRIENGNFKIEDLQLLCYYMDDIPKDIVSGFKGFAGYPNTEAIAAFLTLQGEVQARWGKRIQQLLERPDYEAFHGTANYTGVWFDMQTLTKGQGTRYATVYSDYDNTRYRPKDDDEEKPAPKKRRVFKEDKSPSSSSTGFGGASASSTPQRPHQADLPDDDDSMDDDDLIQMGQRTLERIAEQEEEDARKALKEEEKRQQSIIELNNEIRQKFDNLSDGNIQANWDFLDKDLKEKFLKRRALAEETRALSIPVLVKADKMVYHPKPCDKEWMNLCEIFNRACENPDEQFVGPNTRPRIIDAINTWTAKFGEEPVDPDRENNKYIGRKYLRLMQRYLYSLGFRQQDGGKMATQLSIQGVDFGKPKERSSSKNSKPY